MTAVSLALQVLCNQLHKSLELDWLCHARHTRTVLTCLVVSWTPRLVTTGWKDSVKPAIAD